MGRIKRNIGECRIEGCQNEQKIMRLCFKHHARFVRHGDPLYERSQRYCSMPNCKGVHMARGWCLKHHMRWLRHKDPTKVNSIYEHGDKCTKPNCSSRYFAQGLCAIHYRQRQYNIDPERHVNLINEFQPWSKEIKERDRHECQVCGNKENLSAHHIFYKKYYPKLAYNLNNGITLCKNHHVETHKLRWLKIANM